MQSSLHVKEIRQCNCEQCRYTRAATKSLSRWKTIRQRYKKELQKISGDLEDYNIHQTSRDYDA
jgi:hypothetical protein